MNNLLRTLTESQVKSVYPEADLRLLLATVKESRRQTHDTKLIVSEAFFESLENLLLDLKAVTIDNHDAEAFLKPVSKSEAPDYYEGKSRPQWQRRVLTVATVIANPMDFGTMLKKVKARQYKSKREFKDDLELIWSNCLTYNAAENHPLRPCVKRLKLKADRLLKYITDRKERADPPIPSDIAATHIARPKINGSGALNGQSYSHNRSPSLPSISKSSTPTMKASPSLSAKPIPRRDAPFPDTPAIARTPTGMALFSNINRIVSTNPDDATAFKDTQPLLEKLMDLAAPIELPSLPSTPYTPTSEDVMDIDAGEKRKVNGFTDHRPRKRTRYSSQYATPLTFDKDNISELWWGAVQSDELLANGLPEIPFASSSSSTTSPPSPPSRKAKMKRRKKQPAENVNPPKSLLTMMNNNIKTMKRLRHTHAKFAALNATNNANAEEAEGGGEGASFSARGHTPPLAIGEEDGIGVMDDKVDERPWRATIKGKRRVGGVEIGEEAAVDCMRWMNGKVLEHAGFQDRLGASQVSLGVMAGVASDYLLNVGRTIRYLSDKYSASMTPEEIILHTLFESGTSKVQDLERYISDDVVRYGTRLTGLEEKLVAAYRETTAVEVLDDEGLFEEEDEEETGALAMGDFADALGEDYLGLRELGIAAEFGMSSLTIPKKLLKGKKAQKLSSIATKPTEPPPPYPPPPAFIPLTPTKVEDQIGLLQSYYQMRFNQLAQSQLPPPAPPTTLPGPPGSSIANPPPPSTLSVTSLYGQSLYPPVEQSPASSSPAQPPVSPPPTLVLQDDLPNPPNAKMGPLGQIVRGGTSSAAAKKKKTAGAAGPGGMGTEVGAPPPKKKKTGMVGVGTGNGRKKKTEDGAAGGATNGSTPTPQSQPQPQNQPQPGLPPVSMPISYLGPPPVAAYTMPMQAMHAHMQMQPPPTVMAPPPGQGGYAPPPQGGYGGQPVGGYGAPAGGGYGYQGYGAPPGGGPGYGGGFAAPPPPPVQSSNPEEQKCFATLWKYINARPGLLEIVDKYSPILMQDWQNVFKHFDKDRSGSIDVNELREALVQFGFRLNPSVVDLIVKKYALPDRYPPLSGVEFKGSANHVRGAPPPGITFDRFVRACVVIKQLSESFTRLDVNKSGYIQIGYDQFMDTVLRLP
ncbi:hypothetical protein H0H87_008413 [Tephrocybe sp. NHM501043]|nr:hypothetical protein H0H87_008413 [Tephrocybe sp. NHM501043]